LIRRPAFTLAFTFTVTLTLAGCATAPRATPTAASGDVAFQKAADRFYWAWLDLNPTRGSAIGYHQYDGKLADLSQPALTKRGEFLHHAQTELAGFQPAALSAESRMERDVLLATVRGALFSLEVRRLPFRAPMAYLEQIDLLSYITRDYKPLADRARDVVAICRGAGPLVENARKNLEPRLPRTFIQLGLIQANGLLAFVKKDVADALAPLADPAQKREIADGLAACTTAFTALRDDLEAKKPQATDDFALGEKSFLAMLAATEGVEIDLASLRRAGEADLHRNLAALEAAAGQFAPGKSLKEAVLAASDDRPNASGVLPLAAEQLAAMRRFVAEHDLVTIPSADVAEARESPPFMRFNSAFLRSAPLFDPTPLPSFYFISAPDPAWPPAEQRAYIPPRDRLLVITVHEVWPGHFLDYLHRRQVPSRLLKTFSSYGTTEGWAHYTEELMWDAGALGTSPRAHIAQLIEALTRDVRFLSAIGLHTGGMTVEQSTQLFLDKAFTDPGTAKQQAVRGTFDPMYLNYTLGKLLIRKLRDDYQAKLGPAFSLKAFHDRLLSFGGAPLPLIRKALLGENAGPPL
jgi:hypothetical protein